MDETVREYRHDYAEHSEYGRHGPSGLRRSGAAGVSVHPGPTRIRYADAPQQYGCLRSRPGGGFEADGGGGGDVCVPGGEPRREVSAKAAASAAAGAEARRRTAGDVRRREKGVK